ncbi:hypothetical protein CIW48_15355 [Methylobacterium sp. P1-11]|nr:hypothetical protein CIW48_15355 [Methylobacterium sp. P1-11]
MHWSAVLLAVYAAGLVEFWRLCRTAPLVWHEDSFPLPEAPQRDSGPASLLPSGNTPARRCPGPESVR